MIQPFYASSAINRHGDYRNNKKLLNTIINEKDTKFIPFYNGKNLFIKPECLQVTGSFKFRGAWSALSYMQKQDRRFDGVVAYSSGNHAQGIAAAAMIQKVPAVIIMPKDAPRIKIENTLKMTHFL